MRNWKTNLAGIGAIATGIGLLCAHKYEEGVAAIIAGFGLLAAKDHNTTGKGV